MRYGIRKLKGELYNTWYIKLPLVSFIITFKRTGRWA